MREALATQVKRIPAGAWLALRVAITGAVLVALWRAVGGQSILDSLRHANPAWGAAAVLTLLVQTALSAQRWRVTAGLLGQDLPAGYALREYFLAQTFNQVLPGGVLGDATRAVRARHRGGMRVSGLAVLFERLAGQIAMFLTLTVAFLSTVLVPGGLDWPPALRAALWVVIAGAALLALAAIAVAAPAPVFGERARPWLSPLGRALFSAQALPWQVPLGLAITACNLAAFAFAARAVGAELSWVETVALVPVLLFAMLIPLTVSGWGLREGAAALILPIAGLSPTDAVAASVLFGLALIVAALPGVAMVLAR